MLTFFVHLACTQVLEIPKQIAIDDADDHAHDDDNCHTHHLKHIICRTSSEAPHLSDVTVFLKITDTFATSAYAMHA